MECRMPVDLGSNYNRVMGGQMAKYEGLMAAYFTFLDRKGGTFNLVLGTICAIFVGTLDLAIPDNYTVYFLYLLPISFTTWFAGRRAGLLISVLCTIFWSEDYFKNGIFTFIWNLSSTLGLFCVVSIMLARIRRMWDEEAKLSRTDPLAGAINVRAFYEIMEYEIANLKRMSIPYSVAYLDIDNFKEVNDRCGHKKGDELLVAVVRYLIKSLRKTDLIARIGGDEFVIFLPSTDQDAAKTTISKIKTSMLDLSMQNTLPTTVSIGVVTCANGNCDIHDVILKADELMYEVKSGGKNDAFYIEC